MSQYREEKDSMGPVRIPADMLYGAQTERARLNFQISKLRFDRRFLFSLGVIKKAAAEVNEELGLLDPVRAGAIRQAAQELMDGDLDAHFVLDIFQTGSGTSTNMNANEVLANRANLILGGKVGTKDPVHPNDHVNMGQSSNDVIPTAVHVSSLFAVEGELLPALAHLESALAVKRDEFDGVYKAGRTHLQDATPMRLGQEFSGYVSQITHGIRRVERSADSLRELAIGGTAVGTGINTHPEFGRRMAEKISAITGVEFREAENHFEAQAARDAVVEMSGMLKVVACSLMKIANDLRWLACGPRTGISEINLPELQPGSSIMPGKVNPVMAEMMTMVAAQVIGNDAAITIGGERGNFELNVMIPVMIHNLLESIEILTTGCRTFADRCVSGITANVERCMRYAETTGSLSTALAPVIGYDKAAEVAKKSLKEEKTLREVVREMSLMSDDELERIIDFAKMTAPNVG
ncbi:MAG: class II fumarate hydratase [Candidatus Palauibacterales bacterium]|jgi:fumarate hydratase, class II|nr:class II fumarate hydratase [Candidatus Palauibacterales bacterium]